MSPPCASCPKRDKVNPFPGDRLCFQRNAPRLWATKGRAKQAQSKHPTAAELLARQLRGHMLPQALYWLQQKHPSPTSWG